MSLTLVPITLKAANAFVAEHHRHHKPARGCRFCVAVADADQIVGVAIVGRPVARRLDDGWTAEVVRVATNGHRNACSKLYGAAWRACRALGFRRLVTYTLPEEGGASLRGAGWTCLGEAGGGSWSRKARPRVDQHPTQVKLRWERNITGENN
jgi:L-amino acid N-acyltransferase YncA